MPAREVDREPAIVVGEDIAVHGRGGAVVGDEDVDPAVGVVVGAHHAPALARVVDPERRGALDERAVAVGHEQARGVGCELARIRGGAGACAERLVEPAVGDEQIGVAVIVEVCETGAPRPPREPHPRRVGGVFERPRTVDVPVQPVSGAAELGAVVRVVDAGDEPVQIAVAIVVRHRRPHPVVVDEVPRRVVAQHLARAEIAREQDVRIAVGVDVGEGRRE